eukprot:s193_g9.t2
MADPIRRGATPEPGRGDGGTEDAAPEAAAAAPALEQNSDDRLDSACFALRPTANEGVKAARPASASGEEEAPDPLPNAPAEPQRPWPLRTVRKAVAPLRPAAAKPQPVRLQIRFMPAAASSVSGRPVHKTQVSLHTSAPPTEVLRLLLSQGLAWPASLAPTGEEFGLPGHLLFHGKLLDEGKPLVEQGIQDGCELRLVKGPKVHAPVRCSRGLLMNAHPWEPGKIGQTAGVTAPPDL